MAYSDELKEYARSLYIALDEEGKPAETLRTIAKKIGQKKKKSDSNTSQDTINQWIREGGWEVDLEEQQRKFKQKAFEAEKKRKAKIKADQQANLGSAFSTFDHDRTQNEELYSDFHSITKARLQYNKMYIDGKISKAYLEKEPDLTMEMVKQRMLTDRQFASIMKSVSGKKSKEDELLADAAKFQDNQINVNIKIDKD